MATPWGRAIWVKELAPGLWNVATPSHGGIWVSPERCAAMPAELARVQTFVERSIGYVGCSTHGGRWYEEDCDVSLVACAWPECFRRDYLNVVAKIAARISPVVAVWLDRLPANHPLRGGVVQLTPPTDFRLTGSDRPADAPGQEHLL